MLLSKKVARARGVRRAHHNVVRARRAAAVE
jgi:hypothetical protein